MITSLYYLENEKGRRLTFDPDNSEYFMCNVEGLGTTAEPTIANIDSGFFLLGKDKFGTEGINAEIVFPVNAFENYRTVVDFIATATDLYFVYNPYGSQEYYRKVKLSELTKQARSGSGVMRADLALYCLTPWYLATPISVTFSDSTAAAFRYNSSAYDNTKPYAAGYAEGFAGSVQAVGHLDAAFTFSFNGTAYNPVITLKGVSSGKVYGRCAYEMELASADGLTYSSLYEDSYTRRRIGSTRVIDALPYVDLADNPFFKIPRNEPCVLEITSTAALSGTATVKIYNYYRSV